MTGTGWSVGGAAAAAAGGGGGRENYCYYNTNTGFILHGSARNLYWLTPELIDEGPASPWLALSNFDRRISCEKP